MNEIPDRDRLLTMDDAELGRHCVFEFVKGTGAGGQHRNRVYTAVRVRHVGTGLTATDCTERSQLRNRVNALRKLRLRIAAAGRLAPQPLPRTRQHIVARMRRASAAPAAFLTLRAAAQRRAFFLPEAHRHEIPLSHRHH